VNSNRLAAIAAHSNRMSNAKAAKAKGNGLPALAERVAALEALARVPAE